ncbi:uncharacterized protein LOC135494074 [Lineus longissimus]|uniref:uncharacterized protein LOC135494074 n=1 Tax=Lineus longissimus TaxID=88925 RepID=UPI00315D0713
MKTPVRTPSNETVVPLATLLIFAVTLFYCAAVPGIDFIGEGYDLIYGNPDGNNLGGGGKDPGIKPALYALKMTFKKNQKKKKIPAQIFYQKGSSCANKTSYSAFSGSKSYQDKLKTEVSASAGGGGGLWSFSFAASAGVEKAKETTNSQGNVYFDENVVCNLGTASYRLEVARANGFAATRDFRASVCDLKDKFSKSAYKKFIARWGTHLITKVEFGTKYTKRYKMSKKEFFTKAMKNEKGSVSAEGQAMGVSASVEVNVDKFTEEAKKKDDFGESYTEIKRGTPKLPVPIKMEITPIYQFIKTSYFLGGCPGRKKSKPITKKRIAILRANMKKALEKYPGWVGAKRPSDPKMSVALTWPMGSYGLPKPAAGCPSAKNFKWNEGMSYWGNHANSYELSRENHFNALSLSKNKNQVHTLPYCVKTSNDKEALLDWPAGSYCIMQKGPKCPSGFASSILRYEAKFRFSTIRGKNMKQSLEEGTVPEIKFKQPNTDIYFCCRNDDFAANEIFLPTDKPFYLFPTTARECQKVKGMKVSMEWLKWGKYVKQIPLEREKLHPAVTEDKKEFYCYYFRWDTIRPTVNKDRKFNCSSFKRWDSLRHPDSDMMIVTLATVLFIAVKVSYCAAVPGVNFIGVGYDLIYANPDGGDLERGGTDPGIKSTMKALELTNSEDGSSDIPDEVTYKRRVSCSNSTSYEMFTGSKSYQKKFATQVSASAGGGGLLWDFSFSASAGYEEANQKTNKEGNVFFEENVVCNLGTVGYRLDVAKVNGYSVTRDFAASVCALPDKFSKSAYKNFISKWGTHLITKVEFGTKYTKRYKMSKKQFFTKAMKGEHGSVSAGGGGLGFHASVEVSVDKFKTEAEQKEEFGESYTEIQRGTSKLPTPIKTEITPIFKFFKNSYFLNECPGRVKSKDISKDRIALLRENMENALEHYPGWVGAQRPYDPNMSIPLTWPIGFYGLPKTASGCPNANNFEWNEGMSYWGNYDNSNEFSPGNHFPPDTLPKDTSKLNTMHYCVKTANDESALLDWPAGNYCIMKKGQHCPPGLASSGLRLHTPRRWNHIRKSNRKQNLQEGTVPEFNFHDPYTDRYFCCRDDGFASNEIYLPTEKPFYLFLLGHECQRVRGMTVTSEWFRWGKSVKLTRADTEKLHPALTFDGKEFYCYYEKV